MPSSKSTPKKKTTVEAITHEDTRVNIPTADSVSLVSDSIKAPIQLKYPRDPALDPQLVWKGKDEQDSEDLAVEVPPIFIQEKVDPRALIENLRSNSSRDLDPALSLFDDFDGLEGMDTVEFYQHDANWSNRLILGDSLEVMASLAERENLRGQVQMIYFDPPYGIKFGSNWQVRASKRAVKDSIEDASRDVEQVKAFRDTWELGIHTYLTYLRDRLLVSRDLLTESGSIFVQIGDTNVHLVRNLLDEIFGSENFLSMITFRKSSPLGSTGLAGVADYLLWYAKDANQVKRRNIYQIKKSGSGTLYTYVEEADGSRRKMSATEKNDDNLELRAFRLSPLISAGYTESCFYDFEFDGRTFERQKYSWKTNSQGMQNLILARRVMAPGKTPNYVRFHDDFPVMEYTNIWNDTGGATDLLYVVQTSTEVIKRCLLMTTDPGDLVLDPTCGSGTTAAVSEQWGRRWITCDTSRVAVAVARSRIMTTRFPFYTLAASGNDPRKGFEYKTVPHVTLRSIANNPEIQPGLSNSEIDRIISKHADQETLLDQPQIETKKIRVSGPFTVESLSPHRAIAQESTTPQSELRAMTDPSQKSFETMLLENLVTSGIQNGRKSERFEFESFQPTAGKQIFAELFVNSKISNSGRVAVSIGPRYGTVGVDFIKDAAREAVRGQGFTTLLVLGFAFDPQALEAVAEFVPADANGYEVSEAKPIGNIRILLVRMNADLAMGEKLLKKSKAANLFTVFGEPDVGKPVKTSEGWTLEINGFDVYNPITGDVRSGSAADIAMWMIDTNYNGESFFVRHAYFPGGDDPYKKLKAALKAEIDADAWASLSATICRPFPTPTTGKIAVKIINDYGDEVMKVIEISE
jgi:adenine-specific DNA-methyltransferase